MNRVCWNITNKCNDNCSFCFRDKINEPLPLDINFRIIDNMCRNGINHISFSGGEALLYSGIFELLEYSFRLNLNITLITNCILLDRNKIEKLKGIVKWIAIPIDNYQDSTTYGRNIKHIENVERSLKYIEENTDISVKINTVLTSKNYNCLDNVYNFICGYNCIKRWNVFEFIDIRGNATDNSKKYYLESPQYDYVKYNLINMNVNKNLKIALKSRKTLISSYIVINPKGMVVLYNESTKREDILGDLKKEELSEILDRNTLRYDLFRYEKRNEDSMLVII